MTDEFEINRARYTKMLEARKPFKKIFGKIELETVPIFENPVCYDMEDLVALENQMYTILYRGDVAEHPEWVEEYQRLASAMKPLPNAPKPIDLWPEGKVPTLTDYPDNNEYLFNHDPDFRPYLHEMLLPEYEKPKGAVILCGGGDHGWCTVADTFQSARDFNRMGYQCFLLYNRCNQNPWCEKDSGADASRAVRYVRANAEKYRIRPDQIAYVGFSNGAITGENCIHYYSGAQRMTDWYPDYTPDALDEVYGAPDAFLCIYGPRHAGTPFDYEKVAYPPTFYAVGREDFALQNLYQLLPLQIEHGVEVEIHTFAGVPHGQAGNRLVVGKNLYPNFELWLPLADAFMQNVFGKSKK